MWFNLRRLEFLTPSLESTQTLKPLRFVEASSYILGFLLVFTLKIKSHILGFLLVPNIFQYVPPLATLWQHYWILILSCFSKEQESMRWLVFANQKQGWVWGLKRQCEGAWIEGLGAQKCIKIPTTKFRLNSSEINSDYIHIFFYWNVVETISCPLN